MPGVREAARPILLKDRFHPRADLYLLLLRVGLVHAVQQAGVRTVELDRRIPLGHRLLLPGVEIHEAETDYRIGDGLPSPDTDTGSVSPAKHGPHTRRGGT